MRYRTGKRTVLFYLSITLLVLLGVGSIAVYQLRDQAFFADVYVWYPNGQVRQVSPKENGIFYEPHIHPKGTHVIYFGNIEGPPRIWKTDLSTLETVALTGPNFGARHPAFSWDGAHLGYQDRPPLDSLV